MNEWKKVKLKELIKEVNERNKGEKVKRVLSITNSKGFVNQEEYFEGTVHSTDISNYKIVRKNQFAYNPSRVNVGSIDILKNYEEGALSPMYVVFEVDTTRLLPEYFKYYFHTNRFYENVKNNTQGSVRSSLSFKALSEFDYLLPSIEEQKRIIKTLKLVDLIIENYSELLEKKELFIKSKFVEMFGNPTKNEKGFQLLTVNDVLDFEGGSQPDKKYFEYHKTEANIRLIQIRDYKSDDYITYIPKSMAKKTCKKDDIMIGRYGPPIFQILQGIEGAYNVALIKAIPKKGNKEYLRFFLKQDCLFKYIDGLSQRSSGQTGIEMDKLKKYPFPYPPIEEQDKFVKVVKQIDNQKKILEEQRENYEKLKKGLMQKLLTGKVRVKI